VRETAAGNEPKPSRQKRLRVAESRVLYGGGDGAKRKNTVEKEATAKGGGSETSRAGDGTEDRGGSEKGSKATGQKGSNDPKQAPGGKGEQKSRGSAARAEGMGGATKI